MTQRPVGTKTEAEGLGGPLEEALAAALRPVPPSPSRAAQLRARILATVSAEGPPRPRLATLRAGEGTWIPLRPRVECKILFEDTAAGARSVLLRLAPGATLPPHGHDAHEECFVLEGTLRIGSLHLGPGDYHVAPAGVSHEAVTSEGGALIFLREASSPKV